ncbi:MAG TPA: hypothetical protein VGF59_03255 [Bryobacteraceae bacterium]|jgi:hypothetical protein
MRKLFLCALVACAAAQASDFTGVYARIDRVEMQPSADAPQTVQVWGVFAVADPANRNDYLPPAKGFLYFKLPDRNPQAAKTEWADLKRMAGTKQVVAFGARTDQRLRVRKAEEKAENPDGYPIGYGMVKARSDTSYAPVKSVAEFKD